MEPAGQTAPCTLRPSSWAFFGAERAACARAACCKHPSDLTSVVALLMNVFFAGMLI